MGQRSFNLKEESQLHESLSHQIAWWKSQILDSDWNAKEETWAREINQGVERIYCCLGISWIREEIEVRSWEEIKDGS